MSAIIEQFRGGAWELVATYKNDVEAVRCLCPTGRILGCTVRLRGHGDLAISSEPIPRGVAVDFPREGLENGYDVLVFRP